MEFSHLKHYSLGESLRERHEVVLLVVVGLHALADLVGVGGVVRGLARLGVSIRERPEVVLLVLVGLHAFADRNNGI